MWEGGVENYGEAGSCFWCNDGLALEVVIGWERGGSADLMEGDRVGYQPGVVEVGVKG